jgi:hypothetical protein
VFRAKWDATLKLLQYEVEQLDADLFVVQVVVDEADLRQDGMLRTRAVVRHPGAVVSLDSKHGPLRFACDTYEQRYYSDPPSWQANVRAIALGLQALRAVDRYGVTKRGEQYRGWQAIGAEAHTGMTVEQAAEYLAAHAGNGFVGADLLASPEQRAKAFRAAARTLHPDYGGDPEQFRRLTAARALLDQGGADR